MTCFAVAPDRVTPITLWCLRISLVSYFVDAVLDLVNAESYYSDGQSAFAYCVLFFGVASFLITWFVSWGMYIMDKENNLPANRDSKFCLGLLECNPISRYFNSLHYAYMSRKAKQLGLQEDQNEYFGKMIREQSDLALLKVFESFTEAAPQQVIAIVYIMKMDFPTVTSAFKEAYLKILSGLYSFLVMALCLMSYEKDIRRAQNDKNNIGHEGCTVLFLWRLGVSVSRLFTVSALFHMSVQCAWILVFAHWLLMTIYIIKWDNTHFFTSTKTLSTMRRIMDEATTTLNGARTPLKVNPFETCGNILFSAALGLVYIFAYISPGDGGTFYRYLFYYGLSLIESTVVAIFWFKLKSSAYVICMCLVPYILGLIFMVMYYCVFHPNKRPCCVPSKL